MKKNVDKNLIRNEPNTLINAKKAFDLSIDMKVPGYSEPDQYVPKIDNNYHFDEETTLAILAGFKFNRRVLIQGLHGTGKSTHIEQIAARLNWRCVRINLDSHISRIDLIGKDAIILKDGKQITTFNEGILPWAIQSATALVFDEYDAGRPDVMFVIQRILEADGKLTLLDQSKVISPHNYFRLFGTSNTVGLGDTTGLYHGTQQINQGQMDRWNIVSSLNYLEEQIESKIISSKIIDINENFLDKENILNMVKVANLTRNGFKNGDLSTVMSPRTVISWAENSIIFKDIAYAFKVSFLNKCDETERGTLSEYFQRCFGEFLPEEWLSVIIEKPIIENNNV
jgi:cobaltochelatase CobS